MQYLKIKNSGELDIRLVSLMGGTTKRKDQFKIGQFGTGLKYVLAWLVRNNIDFKIFVGENPVGITTKLENIRGEDFRVIYINGERSSITDQMGVEWLPWMIVREIWCNALDEGGAQREITEATIGSGGATTIYIQFVQEIKNVWDAWSQYFITDETPIYDCDKYAIYTGCHSLRIYKQGILIKEDKEKPALFRYDIKNAQINELRQYTGAKDLDLSMCLCKANEKVATYVIENMTEDHYEGVMDYAWHGVEYSEGWKKAIGNAKLIHQKAVDEIKARDLRIDLSAVVVVPKNLFISLTGKLPGIGALRVSDKINEFFEMHIADLDLKIKSALAMLESCGYFVNPELKFIYGVFGDKTIHAQVNFDAKEILVSEQMLNKPLFDIICMIIEESEHFNTSFTDCSRNFQTHFIRLFTKTLLEKNEIQI